MTAAIIPLFSLGVFDLIHPMGVAMVLMLLQLVRKEWHVLVYIISSYIAYWLSGVGVYYGIDRYLRSFFRYLLTAYPVPAGVLEIGVGLAALVLTVGYAIRLFRKRADLDQEMGNLLFIKSVHPLFLVLLAIGNIWGGLPFCWPLLGYIGTLLRLEISLAAMVGLLAGFTLFSTVPMLSVYILYQRLEAGRFARVMAQIKKWLNIFCLVSIPIVLAIFGAWILNDGFARLRWMP